MQQLPTLEDDGRLLQEVGEWGATKYALVKHYAEMFATSMKEKWDSRVYIDLFAGAGRARLEESRRIIPTSAFLTLGVRQPFDSYVLCELVASNVDALRARVEREPLASRVAIVHGDCNVQASAIVEKLPTPSSTHRVLGFCLADPFRLRDLKFRTISTLSERFVDFLVLIPSYMDAHRNLDAYLDSRSTVVSEFLGDPSWREQWRRRIDQRAPQEFGLFVVDQFGHAMKREGFLYAGLGDEVPVRDRGRLLYHLAFFSRSELGMKFWREARRSSNQQMDLL